MRSPGTRPLLAGALLAGLLAASACGDPQPPDRPGQSPPATTAGPSTPSGSGGPTTGGPATDVPAKGGPAVLVGAGDIATCPGNGDEQTAALLDRVAGTVVTLGDNAYPDGTPTDFASCYDPTWGRHRARTRPAVGNHEYHTEGAAGHFDYFGAAAGPRGLGWYSFTAGTWHVVVLNTNCGFVDCAAGSAQHRWLSADLAASAARGTRCTIALAHHPLFTSGTTHAPSYEIRPLVQTLYEAGVEALLSGHQHQYERFAPQTPAGVRDDARGIRQFVVGTGGNNHYGFGQPLPNSEVRHSGTFGVIRLELHRDRYHWRFLPVGGGFTDAGSGRCH